MWQNIVEPGRPQVTIRPMRIASGIPNATNTHSEYVILIGFPPQQMLHGRYSVLRYTYIACLVICAVFEVCNLCAVQICLVYIAALLSVVKWRD